MRKNLYRGVLDVFLRYGHELFENSFDRYRLAVDEELVAQHFGAAHDAFFAHQKIGADLSFGAIQFAARYMLLYIVQFIANNRHKFAQALGIGSGVNLENARIVETAMRGIDRIDQTALLAHFLKQTRRRAAAENER